MPSQEKIDRVKQISKWFDDSDSLLVLRYRGLRVAEANELRQKLTSLDSNLRVMKNTLAKIAISDTPKEGIVPLIDGPVAIVFVRKDAAAVAKVLKDYSKGRKEFSLLGGWLDGSVLDARQVEAFALLPPREVLLAQLVGMIQSPLSKLAGNMAGPMRAMAGLMKAYSEKLSAQSPAPAEEPSVAPAEEPSAPEEKIEAEEASRPEAAPVAEAAQEPEAPAEEETENAEAAPAEAEAEQDTEDASVEADVGETSDEA